MDMTVVQMGGPENAALLQVHGSLDGSTYKDLIVKARELYHSGNGCILLDLSDRPGISCAGLVAHRAIAVMPRGDQSPPVEWGGRFCTHSEGTLTAVSRSA